MGGPQDVRVSRVPSKPVRREANRSLAIDLWLRRDGAFVADASLRLTPAEAENLHAQLCYALHDATAALISPASGLPYCRKGVLTTHRPA
ncbi:hypothetical protein ACF07L_06370 [Streptomyces anulatus]|uniref:hypothetical protein n=1 Tax=Streptomyces anulatus TaxID=1892 RepID=UPI0036FF24E3